MTPETYWVRWVLVLTAICAFAWFAGPHIIAKGLALWSDRR